jgi:hypothetical protein
MARARSQSSSRRWRASAVVVFLTVAGALLAPTGPLYAAIYGPDPVHAGPKPGKPVPGQPVPHPSAPGKPSYPAGGSRVVDSAEDLEQALTKASLSTRFEPEHLVENQRVRFIATIAYGREPDAGPTVDVGYANEAVLNAVQTEAFEITPVTDARQNLDEGQPDDRGGLTLSWSWDIVPRATGKQALRLEIQPLLVMAGSAIGDLARRNKPIPVEVLVHPNRPAFEAVVASTDSELSVTLPEKLTAEADATMRADLPLHDRGDSVQVRIDCAADPGSVPVTIRREQLAGAPSPQTSRSEWRIRPGKDGVVKFVVAVVITSEAGDRKLEKTVTRNVSGAVDPAPSFWPLVVAIAGGATAVLVLLTTAATLSTQVRRPLTRLWRRVRRPEPPPDMPDA